MEDWLRDKLSSCLDFVVPDEMISYILSLKDSYEIQEYFQTLLNFELEEHLLFFNDLKQRLLKRNIPNISNKNNNSNNNRKLINSNIPKKSNDKFEKQKSPMIEVKDNQPPTTSSSPSAPLISISNKKRNKYINLYSSDGKLNDVIMLKGRHRCDCQASKHKLINNCLKCGRIICEQEGSGSCLFCGNLVCSEEEVKLIESTTKKGENLKKSLLITGRPKGWEEALAQRNRLLEYDKTSEKRTSIIDDQSDYFKTNSVWLSDSERNKLNKLENELREKKHASRLERKVTLDFAGRQLIDEPQVTSEYEDRILREIANSMTRTNKNEKLVYDNTLNDELPDNIHPLHEGPLPIFLETSEEQIKHYESEPIYDGVFNRIQDKEYLEISDLRGCLSMHQPWASLLISGIKKDEGRCWYSSHRGRLWIASTSKPVDIEEVKRMENFYRKFYKNEKIVFPSQYPSGCLLGCVSVQDCLPQEEYRKSHPNGESESPYVFVCTDFQELPIRFPIRGEPKIYKLDEKIHKAAVLSLMRQAKLQAEEF